MAVAVVSMGCAPIEGSGTSDTQTRQVDAFEGVLTEEGLRVEVFVGRPRGVTITADDNLQERIRTDIEREALVIEPTDSIEPVTQPEITVGTGAGGLAFGSARLSGSVLIAYGVQADEFRLGASDGAFAQAFGTCDRLTVIASDNANVSSPELVCGDVRIDAQGGSRIEVTANGVVEVNASGESEIVVHGSPTEVIRYLTDDSTLTLDM